MLHQRKKIRKRILPFLMTFALFVGLFPTGHAPKSRAEGHGLANPVTDENGVTKWDTIYFGNYWQSDTNGDGKADKNDEKEPIKWRVLSIDGDDAFLLADKNLDAQRYNDTWADTTWETCTMRSWLNGYGASSNQEGNDYTSDSFIKNAFTSSESSAIQTTDVVNDDNLHWGIAGGNDTQDKVFLLSIGEVMNTDYGFLSSTDKTDTRKALNTEYISNGGETNSFIYSAGSAGLWWLRSPGYSSRNASSVTDIGYVYIDGRLVDYASNAVRPALHLNLNASSDAISASVWSYAGTVSSDETAEEITPSPGPDTTSPATPNPSNMEPPAPTHPTTTLPGTPSVSSQGGSASAVPQNVTAPGSTVTNTVSPDAQPASAVLAKVTGLKLTAGKKKINAVWKKTAGAAGYQLYYSTSKNFKKKKTKTMKGNKAVLGKLKKKKMYYVKVRAYKVVNGKKVYGKWSQTAKKKCKK